MKNLSIILASIVLSLSSVACSPSMSEPMVPSVQKDPVSVPSSAPKADCVCDNRGGDCVVEGGKQVGSGMWDLTKRGANWVEQQAKDEGNQKKLGEAWDSVKSGASSLYDKAKDAVK